MEGEGFDEEPGTGGLFGGAEAPKGEDAVPFVAASRGAGPIEGGR